MQNLSLPKRTSRHRTERRTWTSTSSVEGSATAAAKAWEECHGCLFDKRRAIIQATCYYRSTYKKNATPTPLKLDTIQKVIRNENLNDKSHFFSRAADEWLPRKQGKYPHFPFFPQFPFFSADAFVRKSENTEFARPKSKHLLGCFSEQEFAPKTVCSAKQKQAKRGLQRDLWHGCGCQRNTQMPESEAEGKQICMFFRR